MFRYLVISLLASSYVSAFFGKNFFSKVVTITPKIEQPKTFFPFENNELSGDNIDQIQQIGHNHLIPHFDPEHIKTIIELKEKQIGKMIVMKVSSMLPHFDSIGHKVLHANNEFICDILALDNLSDEYKKHLILLSIKMAQMGDNFGSYLLQVYYDIVDKSL